MKKYLLLICVLFLNKAVSANEIQSKFDTVYQGAEKHMNRQNYGEAIQLYKEAMSINLPEQATPTTYQEIAKAFFLNQELTNAKIALERARIALLVETGILLCHESEERYEIIDRYGSIEKSDAATEVASKICNYFTADDYFYPQSFEEYIANSNKITNFKYLESIIKSSTP